MRTVNLWRLILRQRLIIGMIHFGIGCIGLTTSYAQPTFDQNLANAGITYKKEGATVTITIDQAKALAIIPILKREGIISPTVSLEKEKTMPVILSVGVVGLSFTALLIQSFYEKDQHLDKLQIEEYLSSTVPGKLPETSLCFTLEMNRKKYAETHWDNFSPADLIDNNPTFLFTPWCEKQMLVEH